MFKMLLHVFTSQNQFASGGLLLMLVGSIGVFLRELPERLWSTLVRQTTLVMTVKDDDVAFQWVKEWFLGQKFLRRLRRVDLDTTLRGAELALIPGPGRHLFWHDGRPFYVWLVRFADKSLSRTDVQDGCVKLSCTSAQTRSRRLRAGCKGIQLRKEVGQRNANTSCSGTPRRG